VTSFLKPGEADASTQPGQLPPPWRGGMLHHRFRGEGHDLPSEWREKIKADR